MKKNEFERLRALLSRVCLPAGVSDLRLELGEDADGEEVLGIWVEIPEKNVELWSWKSRTKIRELLDAGLAGEDLRAWPIIHFSESLAEAAPKSSKVISPAAA
jgi:hypothetical protein